MHIRMGVLFCYPDKNVTPIQAFKSKPVYKLYRGTYMNKNLGTNIKTLRKQMNITQEQLAQALNVSSQAVSKWKTHISYPDITLLPAIADFFGVSIDFLFGYGN